MKLIKFYRHTEQKERNVTSIYTMLPWISRKREKSVNIAHVQCVTKHTFMSMYLVVGSSTYHRYKFFVRPKGIFIYFFIIIKVCKLKQFTNKLRRLPHHWLFCVCVWVIILVCPFCPLHCNFIINLHLIYDEIENARVLYLGNDKTLL